MEFVDRYSKSLKNLYYPTDTKASTLPHKSHNHHLSVPELIPPSIPPEWDEFNCWITATVEMEPGEIAKLFGEEGQHLLASQNVDGRRLLLHVFPEPPDLPTKVSVVLDLDSHQPQVEDDNPEEAWRVQGTLDPVSIEVSGFWYLPSRREAFLFPLPLNIDTVSPRLPLIRGIRLSAADPENTTRDLCSVILNEHGPRASVQVQSVMKGVRLDSNLLDVAIGELSKVSGYAINPKAYLDADDDEEATLES